jgi:hypothetical protein
MLKRPVEKGPAVRVVNGIMVALGAFGILTVGYLVALAFGQML